MKKILLSNKYVGEPLNIVKSTVPEGFVLEILSETDQNEFNEKAKDADYILASGRLKIGRETLDNAKKLKMIQRTGVGLDSLDLAALKEKNIPVYVNHGINSTSVAEHTILLILSCLRKLTLINERTKNSIWKKQEQGVTTYELASVTVGIIGFGNIGQQTARLLKAFGAEVICYDAYPVASDVDVPIVPLDEIFRRSDVISLHCPLTDDTKHIINEESIAKMKDGVIIVNTARGKLIKEEALVEALRSGKAAFAGLDVFEQEPTANKELLELENVIATPHIAGVTYNSFRNMMLSAMRNISLFEQGKSADIEQYKLASITK